MVVSGRTGETSRIWGAAAEVRTDGRARESANLLAPPRVSVVIPALNEEKNLPYVLGRLPGYLHEVILVDGHSTDRTVEIAKLLYPDVRVLQQSGRGKGNALACGFAACTGNIVVMLDADGSADPAEISCFIDHLRGGADFAKGSRFLAEGGSADITRFRRLGNRGLYQIVNALYGTRYTDLCYGYNAFWTYCLPYIRVDCDGFEVETLINVRIAKAGLRVREIPSFEGHRLHGVSNLNAFRDGLRVLKTILLELFAGRTALDRAEDTDVATSGPNWDGVNRRNGRNRRSGRERRHAPRRDGDRRGAFRRWIDPHVPARPAPGLRG